MHLINLLSILLRCNGFTKIKKAVVEKMGTDYYTLTVAFFGARLALGSALQLLLSPTTELVTAGCHIKSIFCCTSQSDQEMVHCCWVE